MKHKHHIIPKHKGGTDDPSNLIELSVLEHAQAHLTLYEKYGKMEDLLAYKSLSNQMDEERQRAKAILGGRTSKNNHIERDEKWKKQTIANTSEAQFKIEFECEFLGSIDTLVAPSKLKTLVYENPQQSNAGLDVYEQVKEDRDYAITVDVARGVGEDYSAFIVVDITQFPHKVVAKYRNNDIKPMLFPNIIYQIAKQYNEAFILCEVNDIGDQVASILQYDLEYQNLLMCSMRGRAGQIVGQGFSGSKTQLGVKMSKTVKKVGSLNLKTLIEEEKLIFNDYEIISELTTFVSKHNSFEAEEGCNDDLAMCLVIYAWLVAQDYFKELTDQDVRKRLYEEQKNQIEQDMAPFGFINDGLDTTSFVDKEGDRWYTDEYGDMSHMWDYR